MKDCLDMRTCEGCEFYDGQTCTDPVLAEEKRIDRWVTRIVALLCFAACVVLAAVAAVFP
jgi:hypothetical protein